MDLTNDKRTRSALTRMIQGHGLFLVTISLPDGGSFKLLIKFNKGESSIVKVYKDDNRLGKRNEGIMLRKIQKHI
jgi:hypothetical protein